MRDRKYEVRNNKKKKMRKNWSFYFASFFTAQTAQTLWEFVELSIYKTTAETMYQNKQNTS